MNTLTLVDTVKDQYGNLCVAPGTVTIAPLKAQYAIYYSTGGLVKFVRTADTTSADTLYPGANGALSRTASSGKKIGTDAVSLVAAANSALAESFPVWVTPAAFAQIALTPAMDTTAVAGQTTTLTVEKQDQYGNHIDLGLAGGNTRDPLQNGVLTAPSRANIDADSAILVADTVTSVRGNRGGVVANGAGKVAKGTIVGTAGVASVGGSLMETISFTSFASSADTQKVYASLGGNNDTSLVRSVATGSLNNFVLAFAKAGSYPAGDSVAITVTAYDILNHRIYTYAVAGQSLVLNNTAVSAITTKDTTYYFTYKDKNNKYVKTAGINITDTVFSQGQATFYLHKFTAEDTVNTVTVSLGGRAYAATTSNGVTFTPITAVGQWGKWMVTINTTQLSKTSPNLSFTVTPRDYYYNVNYTDTIVVNITQVLSSGVLTFGGNPQVIVGPRTFTGPVTGGSRTLTVQLTVFTSDNSNIYGASKVSTVIDGVKEGNGIPTVFALNQNYPNPFNPTTELKYDVPNLSSVRIVIYDILGREVRTLVNSSNVAPGSYSTEWNGLNDHGQQVGSGVYFYRMDANNFTSTKKMLLLK